MKYIYFAYYFSCSLQLKYFNQYADDLDLEIYISLIYRTLITLEKLIAGIKCRYIFPNI